MHFEIPTDILTAEIIIYDIDEYFEFQDGVQKYDFK